MKSECTLDFETMADHITMEESLQLFPFEELPRELLWMIFDYTHDSIYTLRKTSKTILMLVDDYSMIPNQLVDNFIIEINRGGNESNLIFSMEVPNCKSKIFELRLTRHCPPKVTNRLKRTQSYYGTFMEYQLEWSTSKYGIVMKCLSECVGRRISKVELLLSHRHINLIARLFQGKLIRHFFINCSILSDKVVDHILHIANKCRVSQYEIYARIINVADPKKFLLQLSSSVQSLRLYQQYSVDSQNFLWGIRNVVDWTSVIIEMFSKRLDKLSIDGEFRLSDDDLEQLKMAIYNI